MHVTTSTGWPVREPQDLTGVVLLCNAGVSQSGREVNFLHLPTVSSGEDVDAYVAPLADLQTNGARVYIGLIHALHGKDGASEQIKAISSHIPDF